MFAASIADYDTLNVKVACLQGMDVKDDHACWTASGKGDVRQDPGQRHSCCHITLCFYLHDQKTCALSDTVIPMLHRS